MIELVSQDRCVSCGICVRVCPTQVFDNGAKGIPTIARQEDCQTCFMCEAYCPADALYVAPEADRPVQVDEATLVAEGKLGKYRASLGWGTGRRSTAQEDDSFRILALAARAPTAPPQAPAAPTAPGPRP
ncbi:ferredoxin [Planctomycetota bacterium]|nr:ferredoxin [Planctomycetota bacterium]